MSCIRRWRRDFGLGGLERAPAVLELDLDVVLPAAEREERRYGDLISYPAVFQDIAVVVDEAVEAQTVVDSVRTAAGPDLRDVRVFDLYRGEQVGEGRKSLALRLEFRSEERTLTDEEVAAIRERIKERSRTRPGGRCVSSDVQTRAPAWWARRALPARSTAALLWATRASRWRP